MQQYVWDFSFLQQHYRLLFLGLWGAFKLAGVTMVAGLAIGVIVGMARSARTPALQFLASCYVEFFRNIPALVQVFWFYYAIPVLTGIQGSVFLAAATALSLYGGAYFAEIYRSGIQSIERGQWEAGRAIGFGYFTLMRHIVLPQAIKRMIPAFTNQAIEVVKLTTVASTIAYAEVLYYAKLLSDTEFRPLEAYTVAAASFIGILLILSFASTRLERRLKRSD